MKRRGKVLEKYYREQYQKKQFPIEQRYPLTPDMRIVDGITPAGKKILVLGCSTGYDTGFLVKNNDVHGIDIMPQAVKEARGNGIKAIVWNIEDRLPYSDGEFDIVVCKEVLEHLINPEFAMNEIKRVLKKDGWAFISVPNHFWYWQRLRIFLGKGLVLNDHERNWSEWNYFHLRFFTFKGFTQLIKNAGFVPIKFYFPQRFSEIFAPAKLRPLDFLVPRKICQKLSSWKPNLFCINFCVKVAKKHREINT